MLIKNSIVLHRKSSKLRVAEFITELTGMYHQAFCTMKNLPVAAARLIITFEVLECLTRSLMDVVNICTQLLIDRIKKILTHIKNAHCLALVCAFLFYKELQ